MNVPLRVLFLTHRLPYAPNRGDRIRAFHIIEHLRSRTDLEVVSLVHDQEERGRAAAMAARGIRVSAHLAPRWRNRASALLGLAGRTPLTHLLLDAPGIRPMLQEIVAERPPDVVLAYCSGMARFAVEPPLDRLPLVVDLVDVDSAKWRDLSSESRGVKRWIYRREAEQLAKFERRLAGQASETLVVSESEARTLATIAPGAVVRVVPVGIDTTVLASASPPDVRPRVVFCGVMNYAPNVNGILWFARSVWPFIRAQRPDAELVVVGSDPTRAVAMLASSNAGIQVTGTVPDVRPYLQNAAVAIAPLQTARGTQNKVLEALAAGLPAVVTSEVLAGLPGATPAACRVADSPERFAAETLALLALTTSQRGEMVARGDLASLSWTAQLTPLVPVLERAAARTRTAHF